MTPTDLLLAAIAFLLGILAACLFFHQQISAQSKGGHKTISSAGSSNARAISARILSTDLVRR